MTLNEYQEAALKTAEYPHRGDNLIYPALGLAEEAGEAVGKVKKAWRNRGVTAGAELTGDERIALVYEIGDAMWYAAALADELDTNLEAVGQLNLDKLADRKKRNVIKSEGDNR